MDITSLVLSKKYTEQTVDGLGYLKGAPATIKSITKTNGVTTVTFEWTGNSGAKETSTMEVADGLKGLSIQSTSINESNHLIITYTDGSTQDAGEIPKQPFAISQDPGNGIDMRADGIYMSSTGVDLSQEEGNILEAKDDGLYATAPQATDTYDAESSDAMSGKAVASAISTKMDKTSGQGYKSLTVYTGTSAGPDCVCLNNETDLSEPQIGVKKTGVAAVLKSTELNLSGGSSGKSSKLSTDTVEVNNYNNKIKATVTNYPELKLQSNEGEVYSFVNPGGPGINVTKTSDNVQISPKTVKVNHNSSGGYTSVEQQQIEIQGGRVSKKANLTYTDLKFTDGSTERSIVGELDSVETALTDSGLLPLKVTWEKGRFDSSGNPIDQDDNSRTVDFIPLSYGEKIKIDFVNSTYTWLYMEYNENKSGVGSFTLGGTNKEFTYTAHNANCKYVKFVAVTTPDQLNNIATFTRGSKIDNIENKMDKTNPIGTGSLSLNRLANSTIGDYSVAEGNNCEATANSAHAEGSTTHATGFYSHAEGSGSTASAYAAHAEGGWATAAEEYAHAEGHYTIASSVAQHVQGKYNVADSANKYAHIVGGGTISERKNIHTLDWSGNAVYAGDIEAKNYLVLSDITTGTKYKLGIDNGNIFVEEVE